jgi:hypothetical protein
MVLHWSTVLLPSLAEVLQKVDGDATSVDQSCFRRCYVLLQAGSLFFGTSAMATMILS